MREPAIWSAGMATWLASEAARVKGATLTSAKARVPPTQQSPIPQPWSLWAGAPFMSSGQHSSADMSSMDVDMLCGAAICIICMVDCVPAGPMAEPTAPAGNNASEAAIAIASMVRTNCITPYNCLALSCGSTVHRL